MTAPLFPAADAYEGDPLNPDLEVVAPAEIVAALTQPEREQRVHALTAQAKVILDDAIDTHIGNRTLAATCVLFSGGDDSTTILHLFRDVASHVVHVNTGTGIPETRDYVHKVVAEFGLPLVEVEPDDSYEDLVLGNVKTRKGEDVWSGGFPGPGAHGTMYQRLKERALDKARYELGVANSRTKCALWIAGRRREESKRRADVPLHEADGTVVWASPVAMWTKLDLNTYRQMFNVPRNPVSAILHMSGECLCGAFAHPGELDEIRDWFPQHAAWIEGLQQKVRAAGYTEPHCNWGHGQGGAVNKPTGRLCTSCDFRAGLWEAL